MDYRWKAEEDTHTENQVSKAHLDDPVKDLPETAGT